MVDGLFRVRDQVVDLGADRDQVVEARPEGTAMLRGYMAIPLPYAAALGEAGCA